MEEATTYVGASSRHAFCENYKFQPNIPLKMFNRDEVCTDLPWLDIKNCSGILDQNTFKNLPNLEILNIYNSNLEKIEQNTVPPLKNLKSIDICRSTIPLKENIFQNCENLDNLRFIKLGNKIKATKVLNKIKNLEYLMFHHISGLDLSKDMFLGLDNLKYLFITNCTIESFSSDVFEHLKNLEALYFIGNSLKNFTSNAFIKLTSLKILGLYDNITDSSEGLNINYQMFEELSHLETISFQVEILQKLDFGGFKNLKNVQLVIGKASEDILEFLKKKNINVEWTTNTDLSTEPDFSDPNIQICA